MNEVQARLKPAGPCGYRIVCAHTFPVAEVGPCPQLLGYAVRGEDDAGLYAAAIAVAALANRPGPPRGDWILRPEAGYFAVDARGGYRLIHPKRDAAYGRRSSGGGPAGRRPMRPALRAAALAAGLGADSGIVGQLPVLPATVFCPRCSQPNGVVVPPAPEPVGEAERRAAAGTITHMPRAA